MEYLIEDRWFIIPGDPMVSNIVSRPQRTDSVKRTVIQIVKPPRNLRQETTIKLREAWEQNVYFPTIWIAKADIYIDPHILIVGKQLATVKAKPLLQTRNIAAARYIAVIDFGYDQLEIFAFASKHQIPPHPQILGVFERCDFP